jgi:uncharacterized protein (DUF924 family)
MTIRIAGQAPMMAVAHEIVAFWREAGPDKWFDNDAAFDQEIRQRFLAVHEAAVRGECEAWAENGEGALALLILFDQFPRNMFRDSPRAFATDILARAVATKALAAGFDQATAKEMRQFFYLPFMHSESLADQDRCVALYAALGDPDLSKYAIGHRDVIARFGRFPRRNLALGRDTTGAEQEYLDGGKDG